MIKISHFIPAMEPLVCWQGAFTPEECQSIIEFGEVIEFYKKGQGSSHKAMVGTGQDARQDPDYRDTDIIWFEHTPDTNWIFDRFNQLIAKINFDKFQMDLDRFDGFQYSVYKPDGHYDWHIDTITTPPNGLFRKLSLVCMLTEPDKYEGGDLLMNISGKQEDAVHLRPNLGDMLVFYSHIPHKVEPVTSGKRITLVTWALGGKLA